MKIRKKEAHGSDKIELQMTPMIDIVFQLLVFFIMTFKIVAMEGDFNIKMPLSSAGSASDVPPIPAKVTLRANPSGQLTSILYNSDSMPGTKVSDKLKALQNKIVQLIGSDTGPGSFQEEAEIEIDADYNLKYHYVIQTITAVTGKVDDEGNIIKLMEKIKFAPNTGGG